jgi:membrane associated rhomboid family serine protease
MGKMLFRPAIMWGNNKEWYRFISSGLIHADVMHLAFNMFALYSLGSAVEVGFREHFGPLGSIFYILLYFLGKVFASLPVYVKHKHHYNYSALGASGAVSAVVLAFIVLNPFAQLMVMFIPIAIPGYLFGILYMGYSSYMSRYGNDNVGHDAHLYGALFGLVFTCALDYHIGLDFIDSLRIALHL